jgi:hypothetical protein
MAIAFRSAIRNGKPLSDRQMQKLLDDWKQTRNPVTCPHGRPINLASEESSLARSFRRNWGLEKAKIFKGFYPHSTRISTQQKFSSSALSNLQYSCLNNLSSGQAETMDIASPHPNPSPDGEGLIDVYF